MALKLFKKGEKAEKPEKVPKAPKEPKEKSPKRSLFKRAPKEPKEEQAKPEPPKIVEEVCFGRWLAALRSAFSEETAMHSVFSPIGCLVFLFQDKMPIEDVLPEKVATAPSKDPIAEEEEGDATTVESAAEDPVAEEAENDEPVPEKEEAPVMETKEVDVVEEKSTSEQKQSPFVCCEGDVLKNLQAAVGFA